MPRKPPSLIVPKAQAAVDAGPPKEPIHTGKDGKQLRITAKVRFTAGSGAKARTLRLVYQRCSKAAVTFGDRGSWRMRVR